MTRKAQGLAYNIDTLTADDYVDYDSDYDAKTGPAKDVDPYAGDALANYMLDH